MPLAKDVIQARQQLRTDVLQWLYEQVRNHAGFFQRELAAGVGARPDDLELALWFLAGDGLVIRDGAAVRLTPRGALAAENTLMQSEETHA